MIKKLTYQGILSEDKTKEMMVQLLTITRENLTIF